MTCNFATVYQDLFLTQFNFDEKTTAYLSGQIKKDLNETAHPDSKKRTIVNTDGIINCLRQPGQLINQPVKSIRVTLISLIKICVP